MTNLPIASNNSQAVSPNAVTGAAQKTETANAESANPFGAVLARQIEADEANASGQNTPSEPRVEAKMTGDTSAQTGAEQDKTLTTVDMSNGLPGTLVAMLQLPQETKLLAAKGASTNTTAAGMTGAVATARGMADAMAMARGMADMTVLNEANANKTDVDQPAINAGTIQSRAGFGMATASSGKANAAAVVAANLAAADKPTLRNISGTEITGLGELSGNFSDTPRAPQGIAQSTASVVASGMLPNILANDKAANSLQTISSPLGSSGWAEEFSQKITWMGTQQNQVVELHLNPPNLGPLDVVLKISDSQATALFTSPHGAVRDAVENALPRLREMLADNGIMLGNTMVSDQSPRDRSANGFMGHDTGAMTPRETSDDASGAAGLSLTAAQTTPARRHNGMVDTFA